MKTPIKPDLEQKGRGVIRPGVSDATGKFFEISQICDKHNALAARVEELKRENEALARENAYIMRHKAGK